jgi:methylated-DNA-[protein]-cysteine S-methyltransferase
MKHYLSIPSPFGAMLLRAEEDALTGLYFVGQKYFPPDGPHVPDAASTASVAPPRVLAESAEQLAEYFAGERQRFAVPLQMAGSTFQRRVWSELVKIPFGEIASYGQLALRLGLPVGSARAVGAANGRNPVSIIVPCHRVISSAGELTGYAGGLERKAGARATRSGAPAAA